MSKTSGMGVCPNVASIQLGFLPLNHILGRNAILMCMRAGGYITFVRPSQLPAHRRLRAVHCRPHAVLLHGSFSEFERVQPGCEHCKGGTWENTCNCNEAGCCCWIDGLVAAAYICMTAYFLLTWEHHVGMALALSSAVLLMSGTPAVAQKRPVDLL